MSGIRTTLFLGLAALSAACGEAAIPNGVATSPPTTGAAPASPSPTPLFTPGAATPAAGADPSTIVNEYFASLRASDCVTAYGLLTDPLQSRVASADALCKGAGPNDQNAGANVGTSTGDQTAGQVSVQVTVTKVDGSVHNDNVIVVLTGGNWKIADIIVNPGGGVAGQINMATVITNIQTQYGQQSGGATVTLTCPRSGSFPASPGDSFQCSFTDSNGRKGTLTIQVKTARGDYTWSIP
jgi:hypothetical protein